MLRWCWWWWQIMAVEPLTCTRHRTMWCPCTSSHELTRPPRPPCEGVSTRAAILQKIWLGNLYTMDWTYVKLSKPRLVRTLPSSSLPPTSDIQRLKCVLNGLFCISQELQIRRLNLYYFSPLCLLFVPHLFTKPIFTGRPPLTSYHIRRLQAQVLCH